mgnify:CR=1 FL=1
MPTYPRVKDKSLTRDPDATFAPAGMQSTQYPMRRLAYVSAAQANGDSKHVRWLTFGSSVADAKVREVGTLLAAQYGGGQAGVIFGSWSTSSGPAIGGVSVSTVTTNATTGTLTAQTDAFDVWPSGLATKYTATGSRTYGVGGGSFTCDTIEIYYTVGPASATDGGTFSYQVDSGATTNVDTSSGAPSLGIGRTVINPSIGAHTVTIAWVSGNVRIIGVGFIDSTRTGFIPISVSQGGINLSSVSDLAFANWQTFLGWVTPDVITFEMKDSQVDSGALPGTSGPYAFTKLRKWLDAINGASTDNAGPDVILIGSTPASNDTGQQLAVNQGLAALAKTYQPTTNVIAWGHRPQARGTRSSRHRSWSG